ncbi:transposable element Tc1 transposase, partial [Trichonephila clavipes]
ALPTTLKGDRRLRIWRQAHEAMHSACQVGTVQGHDRSIMVWGIFSGHCLESLISIPTSLKGIRCVESLGDHLHPFVLFCCPHVLPVNSTPLADADKQTDGDSKGQHSQWCAQRDLIYMTPRSFPEDDLKIGIRYSDRCYVQNTATDFAMLKKLGVVKSIPLPYTARKDSRNPRFYVRLNRDGPGSQRIFFTG